MLRNLATVVALGLLSVGSASASTVIRYDLPSMVEKAELIVLGTVGPTKTVRDGGRLFTQAKIAPSRVLKGDAQGAVTVEVLGGREGAIAQKVPGEPTLDAGREVLLFLAHFGERPAFRVLGLGQGKFDVERTPAGATVSRDMTGLLLIDGGGETLPAKMPLDDFVGLIEGGVAPAVTPSPPGTGPAPIAD